MWGDQPRALSREMSNSLGGVLWSFGICHMIWPSKPIAFVTKVASLQIVESLRQRILTKGKKPIEDRWVYPEQQRTQGSWQSWSTCQYDIIFLKIDKWHFRNSVGYSFLWLSDALRNLNCSALKRIGRTPTVGWLSGFFSYLIGFHLSPTWVEVSILII